MPTFTPATLTTPEIITYDDGTKDFVEPISYKMNMLEVGDRPAIFKIHPDDMKDRCFKLKQKIYHYALRQRKKDEKFYVTVRRVKDPESLGYFEVHRVAGPGQQYAFRKPRRCFRWYSGHCGNSPTVLCRGCGHMFCDDHYHVHQRYARHEVVLTRIDEPGTYEPKSRLERYPLAGKAAYPSHNLALQLQDLREGGRPEYFKVSSTDPNGDRLKRKLYAYSYQQRRKGVHYFLSIQYIDYWKDLGGPALAVRKVHGPDFQYKRNRRNPKRKCIRCYWHRPPEQRNDAVWECRGCRQVFCGDHVDSHGQRRSINHAPDMKPINF